VRDIITLLVLDCIPMDVANITHPPNVLWDILITCLNHCCWDLYSEKWLDIQDFYEFHSYTRCQEVSHCTVNFLQKPDLSHFHLR